MNLPRIALALLLGVSGCASVTERAHETTLHLVINGDSSCSGTAIGPRALLTATHCLDWPFDLMVYGQPVRVLHAMSDGNDHTILIVGLRFEHWAQLGSAPKQADRVFVFGNPGRETDMYRSGEVYGLSAAGPKLTMLYGINGWFGDSGTGVFNDRGQLVAVISFLRSMSTENGAWQCMGSWLLSFTDEQLVEASK